MKRRLVVVTNAVVLALLIGSSAARGCSVHKRGNQKAASLCRDRNLLALVALSTQKYNIAICKDGLEVTYYYAGQSKQNKNQTIFLPIAERNNPHDPESPANPWLLKAHNQQYTYQVAEFNPLNASEAYLSFSIFENGKRIYHCVTDNFYRKHD